MHKRPFITLDQVTVRIGGAWILDRLNWRINCGENWVLWGANGAGKSTLAKALLGEVAVVQGRILRHYHYDDPLDKDRHHTSMALVSSDQQIDFYRHEQTLAQMRDFSHRWDDITRSKDVFGHDPSEHPVLKPFDLEPLLEKPLHALSAGEMRRLLIVRALARHPRMLILDEPFNGLDETSRHTLLDALNQLARAGTQMVLMTHRPGEIPETFSHLMHIHNGREKWKGPIEDFFPDMDGEDTHHGDSPTLMQGRTTADSAAFEPTGNEPLIQMRRVNIRYGDQQVLRDIDWTVRPGENWALIGPNGAGKSTLLKLITGDNLQGYANELMLFGRKKGTGESIWQIKQQIGYVADELQLRYQKQMSCFDVVCSGFFDSVGLYRHCSVEQRRIAREWIIRTGMETLSSRRFARLSFGQQRMVLIVRAMVKLPRLLILDEPCNGLDGPNRRQLLALLDVIASGGSANLLYVSHRSEEMPGCITHRLHIDGGRVVAMD